MDCVQELQPEEDDANEWNWHNFKQSFLSVIKSPFHHTYGIRNMARPVKGPLAVVREAAASNTSYGLELLTPSHHLRPALSMRLSRTGQAVV